MLAIIGLVLVIVGLGLALFTNKKTLGNRVLIGGGWLNAASILTIIVSGGSAWWVILLGIQVCLCLIYRVKT